MSDIAILHEMIKDTAMLPLADACDKKQITLAEPQQINSSVIIYGIPDNTIVIKADKFKSPDTVFNGSKGECKRADFVIVADTGNKKVIIYIELKKTKALEEEIIQQFTGAKCFVAYCREIGKEFWKQPNFLDGYMERFVSIRHISISKRKTQIIKPTTGVHDCPDRMMKIISPQNIRFNHLAQIHNHTGG
ncbi:MAG: hypothetical protein ABIJ30_07525 [bacterium]